jgi:hypothetical protein
MGLGFSRNTTGSASPSLGEARFSALSTASAQERRLSQVIATEVVMIPSKRGSRQRHLDVTGCSEGASLGGVAMVDAQIWHEWIPRCDPLREEVGRRRRVAPLAGKVNSGRGERD